MASPAASKTCFQPIVKRVVILSTLLFALAQTRCAFGQATYSASQPFRLQGYGTFSYVDPGYHNTGLPDGTNYGFSAGADLDVNLTRRIKPGLDLRVTHATGNVSRQSTYGGGPRVSFALGRIQPYADFLLAGGKVSFVHPVSPDYLQDRSTVFTYGGGADFLVTRGWAVKVDVQTQRWRLSREAFPFYSAFVSLGIRYQLHNHMDRD